jgi:hypothetical protein
MTLRAIRIIEATHSLWTRTGSKLTAIRNPTRILRAMRYRAVLRCWAFRPRQGTGRQALAGNAAQRDGARALEAHGFGACQCGVERCRLSGEGGHRLDIGEG